MKTLKWICAVFLFVWMLGANARLQELEGIVADLDHYQTKLLRAAK